MKFELLIDRSFGLTEGPVWDDRRNRLFFVDIVNRNVHRVALDGSDFGTFTFPSQVGSIGLGETGRLVVALEKELVTLDPDSGTVASLVPLPPEPEKNRLNDGKVGPDGRFYVGSMDQRSPRSPTGAFYRVDGKGHIETLLPTGLFVSNGLAWSADGRTMFHSDSGGAWIERMDFDPETGAMGSRLRIASDIANATGRPDGAAGDDAGNYLSAGVSAGVLNLWSRGGALLQSWRVPVPAPTMPCFCGPDLTTLVVTSLVPGADRPPHPQSGALFITRAPFAGARVHRWKDA